MQQDAPRQSFIEAINDFLAGRERVKARRRERRRVKDRRLRRWLTSGHYGARPRTRMEARIAKQASARHRRNKQARKNRRTNRLRQRPHTRKRS